MGKTGDHLNTVEAKPAKGPREKINFLLVIVLAAATTTLILVYRDAIAELGNYGYLGIFLISLIGNAGILFGIPVLPLIAATSAAIYPSTGPAGPVLMGLAGGAGAGIGESTGYFVGSSGRTIIKKVGLYNRMSAWLQRWGMLAVFILAIVPFFFDLIGMAAGILRFPLWKFLLANWLGRTILYVSISLVVAWGWEAILPLIS